MDEQKKRLEEALREVGINTVEELNKAIKKEKPLNLGLMTAKEVAEKTA